MDLSEMWNELNEAISLAICNKRNDNKSFKNNEEYDCRMKDVKLSEIQTKWKRNHRNIRSTMIYSMSG